MITAAFLIVIMFLGGWHLWGVTGASQDIGWLQALLRFGILTAKILAVIVFFMLVRWSWPRFRFDQLMNLAWKVMLPLGLVNLVTVAAVEEFRPQLVAALGPGLAKMVAIGIPWIACLAGWVVAGMFTPSGTDNTPILTHGPLDIERELADHERRERMAQDSPTDSPTELAGSR
jgi:NADH-quinone oxidoreductase subunit H